MNQYPKLTNYVSEIDQFLQQFDKEHPGLSLSQEKRSHEISSHLPSA